MKDSTSQQKAWFNSQPGSAPLSGAWPCRLVTLVCLLGTALLNTGCQQGNARTTAATDMYPPALTRDAQTAMSPQQALAKLKAGNERFVAGQTEVRNLPARVRATAAGQYPFAVILSCLDSRQPTELVFDQSIGDVFCARVAGNVLSEDILGSMEFGCKVSGSKLIAVIGHSNCGAVKGAIDDVQMDHLTGLLARIKPATARVPDNVQPRNSNNDDFVQKVAEANVRLVMQQIRDQSAILREMIDSGKIALVGGMYDLSTGKVSFFPQ